MLDDVAEGCLSAGLEVLIQGCLTQLIIPVSPFVLAVVLGVTWQSYWAGGLALLAVTVCMVFVAIVTEMRELWLNLTALALDAFLVLGMVAKSALASAAG